MSTPTGATPLGSYLYMFSSPLNPQECLISAHGGYYKNNVSFTVPKGVKICFYGEHNKVLSDPGIALMSLVPRVTETIVGDGRKQCLDYELSKYQGRHSGANESYDSIMDQVNRTARNHTLDVKEVFAGKREVSRATKIPVHVITVRNRWNKSDVNLSYVIKEVLKAKPGIHTFHCSFCRSLVGDDNPGVSKVVTGIN